MKTKILQLGGSSKVVKLRCQWVISVVLAVVLALLVPFMADDDVWASGHSGGSAEHGKASVERGSHGKSEKTDVHGGAKDVKVNILSDDGDDTDESDRPDWAQGNTDANTHSQGGGQPPGSGVTKGDMYGDLWIILRDANGVPILVDIGGELHVQPIAFDENGNIVLDDNGAPVLLELNDDGEIDDDNYVAMEVDFGRLSVGRAPAKVTDHALDEALSKLLADGVIVTQDPSGRIVVDGSAIDSPLENLALYIALMNDNTDLLDLVTTLGTDKFTLAASLLAAAADKTGTIGLDVVAYENVILNIAAMTPEDYVDYSGFSYDRETIYSGDITYWAIPEGATEPVLVTESIIDAVFGGDSYTGVDTDGLTDFVQAADDALQMIEFIHTQIH